MAEAASSPGSDEVVRGVKSVARTLGCSRAKVYELLRRPTDPLRLWSAEHDPTPWQLRSRLVAFRRRWRTPDDPALAASRLDGWLAIARLLGMSVDLAQSLAERAEDPLPVHRTRCRRVSALREALLDWLDGQNRPHAVRLLSKKKRRAGSGAGRARKTASGDRARSTADSAGRVKRVAKERRAA